MYRIEFARRAERDFRAPHPDVQRRIDPAIQCSRPKPASACVYQTKRAANLPFGLCIKSRMTG